MNNIKFNGILDGIVMDRIARDYEFTMPTKHFHREFEIYYLLEGSRYYFIESDTYLVKKGSLVLLDSLQIHKTASAGSPFHDRFLAEIGDGPFARFFSSACDMTLAEFFSKYSGTIELNEKEQQYVESILFSVIEEMNGQSPKYEKVVMMKLSELLIFALRCKKAKPDRFSALKADTEKHKIVHHVADYIVSNYATVDSLDELAKHFFINKSYLSRIFNEVTSFTVQEYINIHRIKKAQEMLADVHYNITEIAEAIGYESITYFERVFKKYTETSPLKYRKKVLMVNEKARERKFEKNLNP